MSEPLYGPSSPYQDEAASKDSETSSGSAWRYPLHDLLGRPSTADAACVPVPQLRYRNLGIRELSKGQGVLETQTRRDAIQHGNSPEKASLSSGPVDTGSASLVLG
jgi:hypothetical protein